MNNEKFIRNAREIYQAVSTFCKKSDDGSFGDWRITKSELKNGDFQLVIYRKITEINLVLNQLNDRKIEAFFKYNKVADSFLADAIEEYCRDHKLPLDDGISVQTIIYFDEIEDFEVFVFKYLLADI